jgi:hypothetical protein
VVIDVDLHQLTGIKRISPSEGLARLNDGHFPYVSRMDGQPVGYGWVATRKASIGELDLTFELPSDDRYLQIFKTVAVRIANLIASWNPHVDQTMLW